MTQWIRVRHDENIKFGTLVDGQINVYTGDKFDEPTPTEESLPLDSVEVLTPCLSSKDHRAVEQLWRGSSQE